MAAAGRRDHSLSELIEMVAQHHSFGLGAVDYVSVPVGVDADRSVVQFGLYLVSAARP